MNLGHRLIFSTLFIIAMPCTAKEFIIANGDNKGLLKAITLSNESPDADVITLAKQGLYAISIPTDANLLPILKNTLVINGNGSEIRRYTRASVTLISTQKNSHILLRNLILAEGSEGAIINHGHLLLDRVKIVDSDSGKSQAIITNFGRLSLCNSELAYNQMPVQANDAGLIINHGELSLSFSKIHDNTIRQDKNSLSFALGALNFGEIKINGFSIESNDIDPAINTSQLAGIINIGKARVSGRFSPNLIIRKSTSDLGVIARN
jgi:hypothetical protein